MYKRQVHYFVTDSAGNWVFNVRGDGSTALNTMMAIGDVMTFTALATHGGTPRYMTALQIDGNAQTVKWVSGSAPSAGNANSIDSYTFSIVKTANATYTENGSMTTYA